MVKRVYLIISTYGNVEIAFDFWHINIGYLIFVVPNAPLIKWNERLIELWNTILHKYNVFLLIRLHFKVDFLELQCIFF